MVFTRGRRSGVLLWLIGAAAGAAACDRPPDPVRVEASRVSRGAYLANGIARCFWCHSPQNDADPSFPRPETLGAGDILDKDTPVVASNLTPDEETGIGRWTDTEIARAIRHGIGRDGRCLRGDHPASYYSIMSDEDVGAVVAYLRSLRPIVNQLPPSAPQATYGESVQPAVEPAQPARLATLESRGAYLVQLGECVGCHTTTTPEHKPFRAMAFAGGRRFVETRTGSGRSAPRCPGSISGTSPTTICGRSLRSSAAFGRSVTARATRIRRRCARCAGDVTVLGIENVRAQ